MHHAYSKHAEVTVTSLDDWEQEMAKASARPGTTEIVADEFPLEKPLPIRRERADAAVRPIRGDEQRVEPEQRRDLLLVVRQVLAERRARDSTCPGFLEQMSRRCDRVLRYLIGELSRL